MPIVSIACAVLIVAFIFTFDDTMFPRYRFNSDSTVTSSNDNGETIETSNPNVNAGEIKTPLEKSTTKTTTVSETATGQVASIPPPRTFLQRIAIIHRLPDDKTTWLQYYKRPFYLFLFPNIVLAGVQFAFGATAGEWVFNTGKMRYFLTVLLSRHRKL